MDVWECHSRRTRVRLWALEHWVLFEIFHNEKQWCPVYLSVAWEKWEGSDLCPLFHVELQSNKAVAPLPGKANKSNNTLLCLPAAHLHYGEPRPRLPTRERCEPSTLRKTALTALLNETERMTEREKAAKNHCTDSSIIRMHTQLNQLMPFFLFWLPFITLERSPELPSKLLILSHKVYCQCIALHYRLR